ncbi:hypothetical protein [Parabacteroides sp. AM08-6]|uniref:hypothetical protein n=1 Tax=Parabacteroides sp. AM08-6 TaxID=2292053 RepID=UPI000EFDBD80|nr:hypothetical protein [Parabacteroides sp. AM08-6]RHJ83519.1 hypothetical protein DW103_07280 [Parabacteroides sp. AM08-6]
MAEFNENPFLKDTPVTPFSNGTEAECWHERNCDKCIKYENKSDCELAYHLDMGFILGTIPLWVAKEIGFSYNPLYQTGRLNERCGGFRTGDEPF